MKIYLVGAVDNDFFRINKRRRERVKKMLQKEGHQVICPVELTADIRQAMKIANPKKGSADYSSYIRAIVETDLSAIRIADMLFVIYSYGVRKGAGAHGEMTFAAGIMKPIVLWSPWHKISKIPLWIFGCVHPKFMIKNIHLALTAVEVIKSLKELSTNHKESI